jgi:hypothetical protein
VDLIAVPVRVEVAIEVQKRAISSIISAPYSRRKLRSSVTS